MSIQGHSIMGGAAVAAIDWGLYPDFTPEEFHCKCVKCGGKVGAEKMSPKFLKAIQKVRTRHGKVITISSGHRCECHPIERKKDAPGSHYRGMSGDVKCAGEEAYEILRIVMQEGDLRRIGVKQTGGYNGRYLHLQICDEVQPSSMIYSYKR